MDSNITKNNKDNKDNINNIRNKDINNNKMKHKDKHKHS